MPSSGEPLICGVSVEIIERYLQVVKQLYPAVDKANFFLELHTGISGINIGVTNQRDALSHLVTLLTNSTLSRDEQLGQVENAEEHLRRAVIETYEVAVNHKAASVLDKFKVFQQLGANGDKARLQEVRETLDEIWTLREEGRSAKALNKWDAEWENGIRKLVEAYQGLKSLEEGLDQEIAVARKPQSSTPTIWRRVALISIGLTIVLLFALLLLAW
jgi:hypothetical protein